MADVIGFPGYDLEEILAEELPSVAVEELFKNALEREFDDVTIIGRLANGSFYLATTSASLAEINWDLDRTKAILITASQMEIGPEEDF